MHTNPKEPVIRLNKEMREEILGNVLKGRFKTNDLKREIATEGYEIIKEVHADFRIKAADLLKEAPQAMQFDRDCFDIGHKRTKGNHGRRYTVYCSHFLSPADNELVEQEEYYHDRRNKEAKLVVEYFEEELELRESPDGEKFFRGFVVPSTYTYPTKKRTKHFFKLVDKLEQAVKDKNTLRQQTAAVLGSCYTMKQLIEVWPSVVDYAPTLVPSPTGVSMVIRIEDIDALIAKGA